MSWHSGFQLRIVDGPGTGDVFHLTEEKMTIGRTRALNAEVRDWILLGDRAVSRQHASLLWNEARKGYDLFHLSSTNYTWVNNDVVEKQPLHEGDKVRIGLVFMVYETADPASAPPPPEKKAPPLQNPQNVFVPKAAPSRSTLALKVGGFRLLAERGEHRQEYSLDGLLFTLGKDSQQIEATEEQPNPQRFDLLLEFAHEPELVANHLILRWLETEKAYKLWKRPGTAPVKFVRRRDGFEWHGWLLDQEVVVRAQDCWDIGATRFSLLEPAGEAPSSVSL